MSGTIGGSYNLFGSDLGTLLGSSNANISVMTNLNTYNFSGMGALREPSTSFFGILAGSGEYLAAFVISDVTAGTVPALDNVTLGLATSPVRPPAFWQCCCRDSCCLVLPRVAAHALLHKFSAGIRGSLRHI